MSLISDIILICIHQPIQPKSLSSQGKKVNSFILQHKTQNLASSCQRKTVVAKRLDFLFVVTTVIVGFLFPVRMRVIIIQRG